MSHFRLLFFVVLTASAQTLPAQTPPAQTPPAQTIGRPDPVIQKMLGEISRDRIAATMQKLASFETRGNFSDPEQKDRGNGAARRWILEQFKSYSPRLEV